MTEPDPIYILHEDLVRTQNVHVLGTLLQSTRNIVAFHYSRGGAYSDEHESTLSDLYDLEEAITRMLRDVTSAEVTTTVENLLRESTKLAAYHRKTVTDSATESP